MSWEGIFLKAMLWHFVWETIIKVYYFKSYVKRVAGVLIWLANFFLLHHIHILVWMPFPICALLRQKIDTKTVKFYSSWFRVKVISDKLKAVKINFLAICCSICCQAIELQLRLVLRGRAKDQVQQAQTDLRCLCLMSREWSRWCSYKWFVSFHSPAS